MTWMNHVNIKSKDGQVYCCMRNKIVNFNEQQLTSYCVGCKMFGGTAQGKGVECFWNDLRGEHTLIITDPEHEFAYNQTRSVVITTTK